MRFHETPLQGAFVIDIEPRPDTRGFNARTWCARQFEQHGLVSHVMQTNLLYNRTRGTLRGLHFQDAPKAEAKVFRCVRGAVYDVIVDMRPRSATYRQWWSVCLTAASRQMLYVPPMFAQGFMTLEDDTELMYQTSELYSPEYEVGIRYDDPAFGITWPFAPVVISDKDRSWPDYAPALVAGGRQ